MKNNNILCKSSLLFSTSWTIYVCTSFILQICMPSKSTMGPACTVLLW